MTLEFTEVVDANGDLQRISAELIPLRAAGDKISDEQKVAGGAVIGGIIGALTSKKKGSGALKGALGGAAAGGVIAIATKGKQIELAPGQELEVVLTRSIELPVA